MIARLEGGDGGTNSIARSSLQISTKGPDGELEERPHSHAVAEFDGVALGDELPGDDGGVESSHHSGGLWRDSKRTASQVDCVCD